MLAARFATVGPLTAFVTGVGRHTLRPVNSNNVMRIQKYASKAPKPARFARRSANTKEGSSLKERLMAPAGDGAFSMGRGLVIGASAIGLGALCFYGLGLSNEPGALENAHAWAPYVHARIRDTYMYFGGGIGVTAMAAVAVSRNPRLMQMMTKNSLMAIGATFAAMIGSGILCQSLPYKNRPSAKHLAWMLHAGIMGAVVAPLTLLGGPLMVRAAWYTAGVVGGLSCLAMCAPSEKFLYMGGPLAIGFGVVLASSIAGMFLPPTTAIGAGLYSISIYGGLVLFSMFLLYDTQKIMKKAEHHPQYAAVPYDPINASLGIYMDTMNIFIRIAMILAGGGNRRK